MPTAAPMKSACSSSDSRVFTTWRRWGVLYFFSHGVTSFRLPHDSGGISGASRKSRVWGRHSPTRFPQEQIERLAKFGTVVESCSKKVAASGVFHSLLQFRRGVLAALCYISAVKGKYANSAGGILRKSLSLPTTPNRAKMTEIFEFFQISLSIHFPKEKENCQRFQKFFLIFLSYPTPPKNQILPKSIRTFFRFPPRRIWDFANSISLFMA